MPMVPFDFQPRTRIVFGQGAIARLGQLARGLGFKRTLLVADQGIVQAGYAASGTALLESSGIGVLPFHGVGQNPGTPVVAGGPRPSPPGETGLGVARWGGGLRAFAQAREVFFCSRGATR